MGLGHKSNFSSIITHILGPRTLACMQRRDRHESHGGSGSCGSHTAASRRRTNSKRPYKLKPDSECDSERGVTMSKTP